MNGDFAQRCPVDTCLFLYCGLCGENALWTAWDFWMLYLEWPLEIAAPPCWKSGSQLGFFCLFFYLIFLTHNCILQESHWTFRVRMYACWFSVTLRTDTTRFAKRQQTVRCSTATQCVCFFLFLSLVSAAKLSSPTAGLQNPMSAVGVGQPTAPTINSSTPIDPSSMQRAYAALGLPYSSQATAQGQSQQSNPGQGQPAGPQNAQAQQQLQQQMRPINALGKAELKKLANVFLVYFIDICGSFSLLTKKKTHT